MFLFRGLFRIFLFLFLFRFLFRGPVPGLVPVPYSGFVSCSGLCFLFRSLFPVPGLFPVPYPGLCFLFRFFGALFGIPFEAFPKRFDSGEEFNVFINDFGHTIIDVCELIVTIKLVRILTAERAV